MNAPMKTRSKVMEMADYCLEDCSIVSVVDNDDMLEKHRKISSTFYNKCDYKNALPALTTLLSMIIIKYGDTSLQAASTLKSIGCCQNELEFYAASIVTRREAIRIWNANDSQNYVSEIQFALARIDFVNNHFCYLPYPVHFSSAITVSRRKNVELLEKQSKIATELYSKHDFRNALTIFASLLGTVIVLYGEQSEEVASILKHVGCCQHESKSYAASVQTRKEAIRIWKINKTRNNTREIKNAETRIQFTERFCLSGSKRKRRKQKPIIAEYHVF